MRVQDQDRRQALTWNYYTSHMTLNLYDFTAKFRTSVYSAHKGGGAEQTFLFGKIINCETIYQHDVMCVNYTVSAESTVQCYYSMPTIGPVNAVLTLPLPETHF